MSKEDEYVYMDCEFMMSNRAMADLMYAGIITDARFTTLWTMSGKEYNRTQNRHNGAFVKVHIHPDKINQFKHLSNEKLTEPIKLSGPSIQ